MNLGNFLKDKRIGYWFSVAITLLFLITGIVYLVGVNSSLKLVEWNVLNMVAAVLCFVGFGASAAVLGLQAFNVIPSKLNIVPYVQGVISLGTLFFFVEGAWKYCVDAFVGIDILFFEPIMAFIIALFLLLLVLSIANIFLKQTTEEEEDHE